MEETNQTQEDDMTHDMEAYDDVACDMATYLMTWLQDDTDMQDYVESCKKPNICQIMISNWVEFDLNQVSFMEFGLN